MGSNNGFKRTPIYKKLTLGISYALLVTFIATPIVGAAQVIAMEDVKQSNDISQTSTNLIEDSKEETQKDIAELEDLGTGDINKQNEEFIKQEASEGESKNEDDSKNVPKDESKSNISPELQAQLDEEERIREEVKRRQYYADILTGTKNLGKLALSPLVVAGLWQGISFYNKHKEAYKEEINKAATLLGLFSFVGIKIDPGKFGTNYFSEPWTYFMSKIGLANPSDKQVLQKEFNEIEVDYEIHKKHLTPSNLYIISGKMDMLKNCIDELGTGGFMGDIYKEGAKELILQLKQVFKLANTVLPINDKQEAKRKLEEYLVTYEGDVKKEMLRALTRASVGRKASYYFLGAPGTGKTRLARAYAEALGLPFKEINLSSCRSLLCSEEKGKFSAGPIAQALMQKDPKTGRPAKNPVIFIDEAHDALNSGEYHHLYSELKMITEPGQNTIRDEALGIDLDITNITLIFAGNEAFSNDTTNALADRLNVVEFPSICVDNKIKIALETLEEEAIKYGHVVNEEDKEEVRKIVDLSPEPGVRAMKLRIEQYIIDRVQD